MNIPEDIREDLSAWLDGELPADRAAEVDAAVQQDPELQAEADRLRSLRDLIGAMPRMDAPRDLPERIRRHRAVPAPKRAGRSPWGRVAVAALLVAACGVALVMRWPDDAAHNFISTGRGPAGITVVDIPNGDRDSLRDFFVAQGLVPREHDQARYVVEVPADRVSEVNRQLTSRFPAHLYESEINDEQMLLYLERTPAGQDQDPAAESEDPSQAQPAPQGMAPNVRIYVIQVRRPSPKPEQPDPEATQPDQD